MNLTIPANGVISTFFDESGITIISASAPFFARYGNTKQETKISQGQNLGSQDGDPLGRIEFKNKTSTAIDLVVGSFGTNVAGTFPDTTDAVGITNITNPFVYNVWDTTQAGPIPLVASAVNYATPIPLNKPFRRVWAYFDASVFPVSNSLGLSFFSGSSRVLSLPAQFKFANPYNISALCTKDNDNANRADRANTISYRNSDGSGTTYFLVPFDVYIVADSVYFDDLGVGAIGGNVRAFLAILSSEVKF